MTGNYGPFCDDYLVPTTVCHTYRLSVPVSRMNERFLSYGKLGNDFSSLVLGVAVFTVDGIFFIFNQFSCFR